MLSDPCLRFLLDIRSASFRDCPCNSAAMLQMLVCRVDNGIHLFGRDVALNDLDGLACGKNVFDNNGAHEFILPPLNNVGAQHVAPLRKQQRFYFAFAITAENACGSRIAMSDNILRLSSMFAFFSAATNLL